MADGRPQDEILFRSLTEHAPIGIYLADVRGHRIYLNRKWLEITGLRKEEAYGMGWATAICREDRQRIIAAWTDAVAKQTDFSFQFCFQNPVKGKRWVKNSAAPMRDSNGLVTGYIGAVEDITDRKEIEQKLRDSERTYRLISTNAKDVTVIMTAEEVPIYTFVSPASKEVFGYEPEELVGRSPFDIILEEDLPEIKKEVHPASLRGESQIHQNRVVKKDGSLIWTEFISGPAYDDDGKLIGIMANIRDVTKIREVAEELAKKEKLFRLLSENSYDIITLADADGYLKYISTSVREVLGYDPDELIGTKILDLIHPDDLLFVTETRSHIIAQKMHLSRINIRMHNKDGQYLWVEAQGKLFYDEQLKANLVHASIRDINLKRQLEEKLMESEKIHRLLSANSHDIIALTNENRTFEFVSPSVTEILGYEPREWIGKSLVEFTHPDDLEMVMAKGDAIRQNQKVTERVIFRMRKKSGEYLWVEAQTKLFHEPRSTVQRVQATIRDISERKKLEDQLKAEKEKAEQASLAKSQFLSTMSHEIRTPMNAIIGLTNLMLEEGPRPDQLESLNLLKFSGENLLVIINDILDFNKIEAGKIELETISFRLKEILEYNVNLLKERATSKGISLTLNFGEGLPLTVLGDPVRLGQVMNNLIGNAVKFTEKGSVEVKIHAKEKTEDVYLIHFAVKDTGIGIKPEQVDKVFEIFTQASSDTTRKFGGTGLGLSITRRLINLMDSTVHVESEFGKGSVFSFEIWLKDGRGSLVSIADAGDEHKTVPGGLVLLVEDNKVNQVVAGNFLKKWGLDVSIANNGKEACEMVIEKKFDLVLMDLQMPEMDGFEAATRIRAMAGAYFKSLPILALTASALQEVKEKAMASGISGFVTKPFQPAELRKEISRFLSANIGSDSDPLHELDKYAEGRPEIRDELIGLLIGNLVELKDALKMSIDKKSEEVFSRALHKTKTTVGILNNPRFNKVIAKMNEELKLHHRPDLTDIGTFQQLADDLIKGLAKEMKDKGI